MTLSDPLAQIAIEYASAARETLKAVSTEISAGVFIARAGELTQAAAVRMNDGGMRDQARADAALQLLAKAVVETEVAQHLAGLARQPAGARPATRSIAATMEVESLLSIVIGAPGLARPERSVSDVEAFADLTYARIAAGRAVGYALALISRRAAKSGQTALAGLAGIGFGTIGKAIDVVGSGLTFRVGDEAAGTLYGRARDAIVSAYGSIRSLLGDQVSGAAGAQMKKWLDDLANGALFATVLESWYGTANTRKRIAALTEAATADLPRWVQMIQALDGLGRQFSGQADLADRLLKGLKVIGLIPVAALPEAKLLLAASHVALGGYIVFAGADAVDAPAGLHRVAGVQVMVERALGK